MRGIIVVFVVVFIAISEAGMLWDAVTGFGDKAWDTYSSSVPKEINPFNMGYSNSCISDLGCFYTGPPFFHPVHRPISLPPSSRVDAIFFLLYTPIHPHNEFELKPDPESVDQSVFDPDLDTKIFVHGFLAHLEKYDFRFRLKDAILEYGHYNVIIVDWSALNDIPYSQSVANSRLVGAQLAKLIQCLMNTRGAPAESFHIIGHSLGAQIAGYAGERIKNLGRITGLDPAGPWFRHTEPRVRLDPTDALFVDVIHSDGAEFVTPGLGIYSPCGHMDFYPNGGITQPGCAPNNGSTLLPDMNCDHHRSNQYFLESVANSACKFLAVQCSSYENYARGQCRNSLVAEMGFHNSAVRGLRQPARFFLRTSDKSPYCISN